LVSNIVTVLWWPTVANEILQDSSSTSDRVVLVSMSSPMHKQMDVTSFIWVRAYLDTSDKEASSGQQAFNANNMLKFHMLQLIQYNCLLFVNTANYWAAAPAQQAAHLPYRQFDSKVGWGHESGPNDSWVSPLKSGRLWDFYRSNTDQGLLYYWTKYYKQDLLIIMLDGPHQRWTGGQVLTGSSIFCTKNPIHSPTIRA